MNVKRINAVFWTLITFIFGCGFGMNLSDDNSSSGDVPGFENHGGKPTTEGWTKDEWRNLVQPIFADIENLASPMKLVYVPDTAAGYHVIQEVCDGVVIYEHRLGMKILPEFNTEEIKTLKLRIMMDAWYSASFMVRQEMKNPDNKFIQENMKRLNPKKIAGDWSGSNSNQSQSNSIKITLDKENEKKLLHMMEVYDNIEKDSKKLNP